MGNPASNSKDCFREFLGKKFVGILFDTMPISDARLASGNKTLIFEDGRALTLSDNGSYWIESEKEVARAVNKTKSELVGRIADLQYWLKMLESDTYRIDEYNKSEGITDSEDHET